MGPKKKYSTDANLAGLSHEAEDLESVQTSMLIVEAEMGVWPKDGEISQGNALCAWAKTWALSASESSQ